MTTATKSTGLVRIEIERYTPKFKRSRSRQLQGSDGRFIVVHESSIADALAEIRTLRNAGAFDAPYSFKQAKLYDADKFNAWVAGTLADMPKPIKVVDEP